MDNAETQILLSTDPRGLYWTAELILPNDTNVIGHHQDSPSAALEDLFTVLARNITDKAHEPQN